MTIGPIIGRVAKKGAAVASVDAIVSRPRNRLLRSIGAAADAKAKDLVVVIHPRSASLIQSTVVFTATKLCTLVRAIGVSLAACTALTLRSRATRLASSEKSGASVKTDTCCRLLAQVSRGQDGRSADLFSTTISVANTDISTSPLVAKAGAALEVLATCFT